jgi:hypothetical protein
MLTRKPLFVLCAAAATVAVSLVVGATDSSAQKNDTLECYIVKVDTAKLYRDECNSESCADTVWELHAFEVIRLRSSANRAWSEVRDLRGTGNISRSDIKEALGQHSRACEYAGLYEEK